MINRPILDTDTLYERIQDDMYSLMGETSEEEDEFVLDQVGTKICELARDVAILYNLLSDAAYLVIEQRKTKDGNKEEENFQDRRDL